MRLTWKFDVEIKGDDAYVNERQDGVAGLTKWGPMPRDMAGPFIDERKEQLSAMVNRAANDVRLALAEAKEPG